MDRTMKDITPKVTDEEAEFVDELLEGMRNPKIRRMHIKDGRRGRVPLLSREQVDKIKDDHRPVDVLAQEYGVSASTIIRAKRHIYSTVEDNFAHSYNTLQGKNTIPKMKLEAIANATGQAKVVAREFGVSPAYVYLLRRQYGTQRKRQSPLPPEVIDIIIASPRPVEELAKQYSLSVPVILMIRREYGEKQVHS